MATDFKMTMSIASCTAVQGSSDLWSQLTAVRIHCPFTEMRPLPYWTSQL